MSVGLLALVVVLAAVIPWLIPRGSATTTDAAEAPPLVGRADPSARGPAAPSRGPTDATVRALAQEVRSNAGSTYDRPVSAKELSAVQTTPGPYRELGRVEIPSIGLAADYGEGVFAKTLDRGPGHWPGTPMPGRSGNAVLSGHRNTHTQPFKYLNVLKPDDKIIVRPKNQASVTFRVVKTTIVKEAEFKDFVLRQPSDDGAREITLFACHPEGNPVYRIVVRAVASPS